MYPVLIVLAALLFFAPALLNGEVTLPVDILGYMYPWSTEAEAVFHHAPPQNALIQDLLTLMTPWYEFAWREWRAGRIPLWNPFQIGGMPFLANDESAVLFPLQLVAMLMPIAQGLQFQMVAETVGTGLGMYAYLRSIRLRRAAACLGGLALMLSGFFVLWLDYPLVAVAMWLPWTLLCCEKLLTGASWVPWTVGLAVFTAAHLLAGHIQTSAHVLLVCGTYTAFRAGGIWFAKKHQRERSQLQLLAHRVLPIVLGVSLGVAAAAVQLLPTLQYTRESYTLTYRAASPAERPQPLGNVASWLIPNVSGNPAFDSIFPAQQTLNGAYFNYNERTAYVSIPALVLAAFALLHRRRRFRHFRWLFGVMLALAACIAYGVNPIYSTVTSLPLLHEMNHNRLIFVMAFCIACLAAIGFDALLMLVGAGERRESGSTRVIPIGLGVVSVLCTGVLLLLCALVLSKDTLVTLVNFIGGDVSGPGTVVAWLRAWSTWALVVLLGCVLLLGATLGRRIDGRLGCTAIALLLVADLLVVGQASYPRVSPAELYPSTALIETLRSFGQDARVAVGQEDWHVRAPVFMPNIDTVYGIRDMSVYEALIASRAHFFMDLINRYGPNRDQPTVLVPNFAPDYHALAVAGVTHFLVPTIDGAPPVANAVLSFQSEFDAADQPLEPLSSTDAQAQTFVAPTDDLSGMAVFVKNDTHLTGTLALALSDPDGANVVNAEADLASAGPRGIVVLPFSPIAHSAGRSFTAAFTIRGTDGGTVSLFGDQTAQVPGAQRFRDGAPAPGVLRYRLYRSADSSGLQAVWSDSEFTLFELLDARPRAYVASGVLLVHDAAGALSGVDRLHVPGADAIVESSANLSSAGGTANIVSDVPGDVTVQVRTSAPGFVVLNEGFGDGGWNAQVDGQAAQVMRANYLFQGVSVPAGEHVVRFHYWPWSLTAGLTVSAGAALVLFAMCVWHFARKKARTARGASVSG